MKKMDTVLKVLLCIFLPFALIGCKDKLTYPYLMQHPLELKQAITKCQSTNEKSKEQAAQCEIVTYAAVNMMSIISEQQDNPEKFGQRIMDVESAYVKASDELHVAQQALDDFQQRKQTTATEIKAAQGKVENAKKTYDEKREEMKILLAVIGLNSPE